MAAVTVAHNALKTGEVLLFYCAEDQQVNLARLSEIPRDAIEHITGLYRQPKQLTASGSTPSSTEGFLPSIYGGAPLRGVRPIRGGRDCEAPQGVVRNPSDFSCVMFRRLLCIYGIRTDNAICIVSPEFRTLKGNPKTTAYSLASCGDGNTGWLYYIAGDPAVIYEYRLDPGAYADKKPRPDPESKLAAYYNHIERKRYCVYQDNGSLYTFEGVKGTIEEIENTTSAKESTPLAICMANKKGETYLYFSNSKNMLVKMVYTPSDGWGSPKTLSNAPALLDGTNLTALVNVDENEVLIFYIASSSSDNFYQYNDPI